MTGSLRQLLASLIGYMEIKIFGNLGDVTPDEEISRYLFQSSQFSKTHQTAKYNAFMPPTGREEVSVYRTNGLSLLRKKVVAKIFVEPYSARKTKACAKFVANCVHDCTLEVSPHPKPDRRHANIVGWPEAKSARIAKAKQLAKLASVDCF